MGGKRNHHRWQRNVDATRERGKSVGTRAMNVIKSDFENERHEREPKRERHTRREKEKEIKGYEGREHKVCMHTLVRGGNAAAALGRDVC
jgi:hypothetical protein